MINFYDDEEIICDGCGEVAEAGQDYYEWNGMKYCSEECVKDAMFDLFSKEVDKCHLWTAEEKEWEYADRKFEEYRDELAELVQITH